MADKHLPRFIINSTAPIRICDNGGWTDTWFAHHGKIFNIGVQPYAEVQIAVYETEAPNGRLSLNIENYGQRYVINPHQPTGQHPLLEATIEYMRLPPGLVLDITIFSKAPSGASTGTSAAVTVALIGALNQLTARHRTPHEIAYAAQIIETEFLHQQCGIQDQLCSAYGGINYIEMFDYPHASVSPLHVSPKIEWELENRLAVIYLGKSHRSSDVHQMVIQALENAGPDCPPLNTLRTMAERSRDAVYAEDFGALGQAMIANTHAQHDLHPALISPEAARVIDIARAHGALGWKVNGAGGDGGSVTILGNGLASMKRTLLREICEENSQFTVIPISLSRFGVRVWRQAWP
jgi:D-glycero-alpha-D-manno-heptose-7-phosphate kinase